MTAAMSTCRGGDVAAPACLSTAAGAAPGCGDAELELAAGPVAAGLAEGAGLAGRGPAGTGLAPAAPPKIDDMMFPNTDIFSSPELQGPHLANGTVFWRTNGA